MMSSDLSVVLLWTATLSSGLMAGVYFAFSTFIMKAFNQLDTSQSIAAMNSINEVILRSLFMPIFFGSSIASLLLIVSAFANWGDPTATLALIAGMVYFFGMFVCTAVFNVPLNNSLASLSPDTDGAEKAWSHYQKNWTIWNHLRAVSSLVTCALCIYLLA